jgi:hypothetical protein
MNPTIEVENKKRRKGQNLACHLEASGNGMGYSTVVLRRFRKAVRSKAKKSSVSDSLGIGV